MWKHRTHLIAALWCVATGGARAGVSVLEVRAQGVALGEAISSSSSGAAEREPLRIAPGTRDVRFRFGGDGGKGGAARFRYKLEGHESAWREGGGTMRLVLRFYDRERTIVGAHEHLISGETLGWKGQPALSNFAAQREEAAVPARAAWVGLYAVAGGGASTVGLLALDGMTLRIEPKSGQPQVEQFGADPGKDLEQRLGVPERWQREGSRPEMAQVWPLSEPAPHHVLVLNDDDPEGYTAWATPAEQAVPVTPGDRVILEWRQAYSVGVGGVSTARYSDLPPGNYWFRVSGLSSAGVPTGEEVSVPLTVLSPWWARWWFWAALAVATAGLSAWIVRRTTQRRMQWRLEQLERQRLLESERARIARDIHDDLGANLAEIAMLSELAQGDLPAGEPVRAQLNEIFVRAHGTARRLDEIVWAINPENDSLEHLAGYLGKFAQDHLTLARIRCRLDVPETLPAFTLPSAKRHHLFLAAKEALHNAVKHGAPSEVAVRMAVQDHLVTITIEDNGAGFTDEQGTLAPRRGSANMRQRLEQIGGTFQRRSTLGRGTVVTFTFSLP